MRGSFHSGTMVFLQKGSFMKVSDIGVILFMYAVCFFFYLLILDLPEEAQTYPFSIVASLALLTTVLLLRNIVSLFRTGLICDLPRIFQGFNAKQFFVLCLLCASFIIGFPFLGFYCTSFLFLLFSMLFLRVPKGQLFLTILVLALLIYVVFTLFLKVPMPVGSLFQ